MRFPIAAGEGVELRRLYDAAVRQGYAGIDFDVECWLPGQASRRPTDPGWFRTLLLQPNSLRREDWELMLNVNTVNEPMGQALLENDSVYV